MCVHQTAHSMLGGVWLGTHSGRGYAHGRHYRVGTVRAWASEFQRALVRGQTSEPNANRLPFVSRFRVILLLVDPPANDQDLSFVKESRFTNATTRLPALVRDSMLVAVARQSRREYHTFGFASHVPWCQAPVSRLSGHFFCRKRCDRCCNRSA